MLRHFPRFRSILVAGAIATPLSCAALLGIEPGREDVRADASVLSEGAVDAPSQFVDAGPPLGKASASISGIAVDTAAIYWSCLSDRTIWKVPREGGRPACLYQTPAGNAPHTNAPGGLVTDNLYVYWFELEDEDGRDHVNRIPKSTPPLPDGGCNTETVDASVVEIVAPGNGSLHRAFDLSILGSFLYVTLVNSSSGRYFVDEYSTSATPLYQGDWMIPNARLVKHLGPDMFVVAGASDILRQPRMHDASDVSFAQDPDIRDLGTSATEVFWLSGNTLRKKGLSASPENKDVLPNLDNPIKVAVDSNWVYVLERGAVRAVRHDGTQPQVLVSLDSPTALTAFGNMLYVGTASGEIHALKAP